MEEIDLVSKDTVADLIKQKFESPLPKCQDDDDPFVKVVTITFSQTLSYLKPVFFRVSSMSSKDFSRTTL